ncbi:MAG: DUF1015 family protein [Oscillospiraceae bacterium]|nr:DUF1015 family protein [Oscillospiraceae bacterium]
MPVVHPFRALRPKSEQASAVAALPYDVLSTAEARVMAKGNPHSFLHVDKPEMDLADDVHQYAPEVYAQAKTALDGLVASGVMTEDTAPCFYIYRQTVGSRAQTGLAACAQVSDYNADTIKKHELTRTDKENDRVKHVDTLSAHTGPIFLTYRADAAPQPKALMQAWIDSHKPEYDFKSEDGVGQTMWVVDDPAAIKQLSEAFEGIEALYIADGHHRAASASRVAAMRNGGPDAESERFLSVIFPHDDLIIMDYNRLLCDLNGMDAAGFLTALGEKFEISESATPVKPTHPHTYGVYLAGKWYTAKYKLPAPTDVVERLAVAVLQNEVLAPLLGIQNPQTDKRIDFVGGIRGTAELEQRVNSGEMALAFSVCPTTLTELMDVSDAGRIMPPKSTWFEPKLRSGLLIHKF